jgi:hypothetical protein
MLVYTVHRSTHIAQKAEEMGLTSLTGVVPALCCLTTFSHLQWSYTVEEKDNYKYLRRKEEKEYLRYYPIVLL